MMNGKLMTIPDIDNYYSWSRLISLLFWFGIDREVEMLDANVFNTTLDRRLDMMDV